MALSGLPLLAASCLAYFSFALRCWRVWACTSSKLWSGRRDIAEYSYHVQLAWRVLSQAWKCRRIVFHVIDSRDRGSDGVGRILEIMPTAITPLVPLSWINMMMVWKCESPEGVWVERFGLFSAPPVLVLSCSQLFPKIPHTFSRLQAQVFRIAEIFCISGTSASFQCRTFWSSAWLLLLPSKGPSTTT